MVPQANRDIRRCLRVRTKHAVGVGGLFWDVRGWGKQYDGSLFGQDANWLGLFGRDSATLIGFFADNVATLLLFLHIYFADTLKQEVFCELVNCFQW